MKSRIVLASLVSLLLAFALGAQAKEVRLVSLDWPPYIGSEVKDGSPANPNFGYVATLVTEALKKSGYVTRIEFRPWDRAVYEATTGVFDGLFPEYYSKEREADFVYSSPFPGGPVGFMKRKGDPIKFSTLKDLTKYSIGIVSGYVNTDEFDAANYLKKDAAVDDETNIRKLAGKRVDLIFIDKFVGEYMVKTKFPDLKDKLEFMDPGLEVKPLYIVFSKKAKDYQAKLKAFNDGLAKLKAEGKIETIMKAHGFAAQK